MTQQHAPTQTTVSRERQSEADMHLSGGWLVFARGVWVVLVVFALSISILSIPADFAYLHTSCKAPLPCDTVQLTTADIRELRALGVSVDFYAAGIVILHLLFVCAYCAVGAVLFWRKSNDRMALLASFALVTFPIVFNGDLLEQLLPDWRLPIRCAETFGAIGFFLLFYLFPDGHFVPRWTRWLMAVVIPYWLANLFAPVVWTTSLLKLVLFCGLLGSLFAVQTYRYRRVSTPPQRQQTKWVVFGLSVALLDFIGLIWLHGVFSLFSSGLIAELLLGLVYYSLYLLIPVSLGFAILRYRLWDIDLLINRTLVYSTLTVLLALLYGGLVIALQSLLRGIFNQTNEVAIVVSTLAIAALFQPVRHHIQKGIDRRFYRRKYDAARTLAAFNATLRHQVDLSQLSEQLVAVVQETMQPVHVSLWLRRPEGQAQRHVSTWVSTPLLRQGGGGLSHAPLTPVTSQSGD
jgi:hypothetical protein